MTAFLTYSTDFDFMYSILLQSRKDIPKETFLKFARERKHYVINKNQGFVFIGDNNEIGYYIDKMAQGRGLATRAVKELMKQNPRKYFFTTITNKNKASQKVVENLGFKPKGTLWGLDGNKNLK